MGSISNLIPLAVFLLIAFGVIAVISYVVSYFQKKPLFELSFKNLWPGYLYLISFITLVGFLIGGSVAITGLSAKLVEPQFGVRINQFYSYTNEKGEMVKFEDSMELKNNVKIEKDGQTYYYDESQISLNLIQGISVFLSLGILFAVHRFLAYKSQAITADMFEKMYLWVSLAFTSVVSVIFIPTTIYGMTQYFVMGWDKFVYSAFMPGESLGVMLMFVPAWIVFIYKVSKAQNEKAAK